MLPKLGFLRIFGAAYRAVACSRLARFEEQWPLGGSQGRPQTPLLFANRSAAPDSSIPAAGHKQPKIGVLFFRPFLNGGFV